MELPNVIRLYPLLEPERKKLKVVEAGGRQAKSSPIELERRRLKVVEAGGGQVSPSKHIDTNGQTFTKAKRIRDAINNIPGVRAVGQGEFVGFHAEANSISEMVTKLNQILTSGHTGITKSVCDGDPVRIT